MYMTTLYQIFNKFMKYIPSTPQNSAKLLQTNVSMKNYICGHLA